LKAPEINAEYKFKKKFHSLAFIDNLRKNYD